MAKQKIIIDLSIDTNIVNSKYGIGSIWNWSDENNIISGTIEILEWKKEEIILLENISVDDIRRSKRIFFKGIRTFKYKKGW